MNVKAFHDSTKLRFREPFGALRCGESAVLRLFVWGDGAEEARAVLRIWSGGERFTEGASRFELGAKVFEFNVTAPDAPGMIWYNFRVVCGGKLYYVGAADAELRSGASEFTEELPHDFRITVYDKDFTAPGAFAGRIAYQIFPDRFARGEYPGLAAGIAHHRALGRRVTEKAWDEEVDFLPGTAKNTIPRRIIIWGISKGSSTGYRILNHLGSRCSISIPCSNPHIITVTAYPIT